jgi:hypothetical protein
MKWWFFKMLKVVMARGRRLKKGGGDLEAQKQNVASLEPITKKQNVDALQPRLQEQNVVPSKLKHGEQNVVSSKLKIDESSNLCGLELTMVTIYNSNDEITPNIDWEF